jgi:MFS family permease
MFAGFRRELTGYPRQFWLMFAGVILLTLGITMIWPFLMIYASETLSLSLATVASLMTINAITGLTSSILAGPVVDWVGRKWVMIVGLVGNGLCYLLLSRADNYGMFAIALGGTGLFHPLFSVGSDAMLADLIPSEKRQDAYALYRMARNIGVAAGPAIGGFVLAHSYKIGLYGAAAGILIYGLLLSLFARETIPASEKAQKSSLGKKLAGYWSALRDKPFMELVSAFTLIQMTAVLVWVLLSVYVKTFYGISERLYGWLPTTNALMVVFLQVGITRSTKRFPLLQTMRWGAIFYVIAPLIVALATGFWGFWLAMVFMTLGELLVVPLSSAYAANLAPIDKRGRYMSLYGLTWHVALGISPVLGGFLSDTINPRAPWWTGVVLGTAAVAAFWWMNRRRGPMSPVPDKSTK